MGGGRRELAGSSVLNQTDEQTNMVWSGGMYLLGVVVAYEYEVCLQKAVTRTVVVHQVSHCSFLLCACAASYCSRTSALWKGNMYGYTAHTVEPAYSFEKGTRTLKH